MAGKLRHGGREWEIARLADRQHGVVGRDQLAHMRVPERTIERWLDSGRLHALHRGVFAVGHPRIGEAGRRWSAVLAYGETALLSHRSAATLWGLARQRSSLIDITAETGRQGICRREGIFIHRGRLHPEDRDVRAGIPVTTVARTLFDMAEFVSLKRLESAWEEADRLGFLELREVERVCEWGYGRRALRPIRRLLTEARAATITRSPLEDEFAAFCRDRGLPTPSFNTTVLGFEVDALWPRQRLAAELDSWEFHGHRAAFERDRARDSALQVAGYRIIRVTHRRIHSEADKLGAEISALLSLT
jgi:very-short-patch-repair endonuclease